MALRTAGGRSVRVLYPVPGLLAHGRGVGGLLVVDDRLVEAAAEDDRLRLQGQTAMLRNVEQRSHQGHQRTSGPRHRLVSPAVRAPEPWHLLDQSDALQDVHGASGVVPGVPAVAVAVSLRYAVGVFSPCEVHPTAGDLLLGHDRPCDTRDGERHCHGQVVGHEGGESIDDRPQLVLSPAQNQWTVIAEHWIVEQAAKGRNAPPSVRWARTARTITTRCGLSGGAWPASE